MKDPIESRKEYIISLLKKYWEYDENIDRENMDNDTIDKMGHLLIIRDENKRKELINTYKVEQIKKMKEQRKKAEDLLARVKNLTLKIREAKAKMEENKNIDAIEDIISNIPN